MKRKLLTISLALATAIASFAIPAKKGIWQTIRLTDGTEVRAQLMGDEHVRYFETQKGERYTLNENGIAVTADIEQMTRRAMERRKSVAGYNRMRSPRRVTMGQQTHYTGQKKGIVILMQFKDTKFKSANNKAKYNDIMNKENYSTSPFKGSVADYFKAQSGGIFELTFDVVGPYTAANNASYYGKDYGGEGNDQHPDELIVEAVTAANAEVNFKDYDWDGDGEVDQVFILYAGTGQADGGSSSTIWPHMWYLDYTGKGQTLDGVRINTYACSNEIMTNGTIEGIGCFCHEFSHCLGFPDFYDTSYSGWYGTGGYDLMCSGSYNGNTYQPAGYTAYEKWMAGWLEPIVLDKDGVTVDSLKPLSNGGDAYIIYNDANHNEYYMLENRQKVGWDASIPGKGLMITHIDFNQQIWEDNNPNTKTSGGWGVTANDHQRYSIICADNSASDYTASGDLYPNNSNDSLTDTSTPKASLFNKNTDGKKLMHKPITKIKQKSNYLMSFLFRGGYHEPDTTQVDTTQVDTTHVQPIDTTIVIKGDTLFYESFDKCTGTGGNDGKWSGSGVAGQVSKFIPDNDGWVANSNTNYGGLMCARFGSSKVSGTATTPEFPIDGEATLTFKAAAWDASSDGDVLEVTASGGVTVSQPQLTMPKGEWGYYTLTLSGKAMTKLTFTPANRFFLDEVFVKILKKEPNFDVDGNGTVDMTDLSELLKNMGTLPEGTAPNPAADINGDGTVNIADIIILLNKIQATNEKP